jgi:hypothetical protein
MEQPCTFCNLNIGAHFCCHDPRNVRHFFRVK